MFPSAPPPLLAEAPPSSLTAHSINVESLMVSTQADPTTRVPITTAPATDTVPMARLSVDPPSPGSSTHRSAPPSMDITPPPSSDALFALVCARESMLPPAPPFAHEPVAPAPMEPAPQGWLVPPVLGAQPISHASHASWPPPPSAAMPPPSASMPPPATGLAALATTPAQRIYVAVSTTIMAVMAIALFVMGCSLHRVKTAQAATPAVLAVPVAAEPPPACTTEAAHETPAAVAAATTAPVTPAAPVIPAPPPARITPTPLARSSRR